jgi:menaquinol-cytochrome c reductase cytochrome b/c subunit
MAGIPEHLLKRAQEAREKAAAGASGATTSASSEGDSRIPSELLDRNKSAVAVAEKPGGAVVASQSNGGVPVGAGPGGHTQRLLTVVKSGSIQDVKAVPVDKVHTWPHLLGIESALVLSWVARIVDDVSPDDCGRDDSGYGSDHLDTCAVS